MGLSADDAMKIAKQTLVGSSALLAQSSEEASALRRAVTTPGGVTEAGFQQLLAPHGLNELILKTMTAVVERARELSRLA
jgi:pyrroline-5-carboxylate reductase